LKVDSTTPSLSPAQRTAAGSSQKPGKNSKAGTRQSAADQTQQEKVKQQIQELKAREQKVIAHEMAHKTAGGQYAGAVRYQYTTGPDQQSYIVGGEVSIDTSEAKTPEETVQKMEQVKRAALAPADPSPQDYSVASAAEQIEQKARYEMMKASYEKSSPQSDKRIDTYA
jgi:SprA-related family